MSINSKPIKCYFLQISYIICETVARQRKVIPSAPVFALTLPVFKTVLQFMQGYFRKFGNRLLTGIPWFI